MKSAKSSSQNTNKHIGTLLSPVLLLVRLKRQKDLGSQLCWATFSGSCRAAAPSDTLWQVSSQQPGEQHLPRGLPAQSPVPRFHVMQFSFPLNTEGYKRDFAASGNYSNRQSVGKHAYPLLSLASASIACISQQLSAIFPS